MKPEEFSEKLPFVPYDYQEDYLNGIYEAKKNSKNYLITLPTGCGKSVAFEYVANTAKTIYTVPIRALANEKLEELPERYPDLRVLRDTGEDFNNRKEFDYINQDVIITTNERLLSILNTSIKEKVFENVEYIVFDEIHMITDINRGSTLEWVIMLIKKFYPHITIIGLSATLPNYKEFADWLDADYTWLPSEKRPIPLEFHFGKVEKMAMPTMKDRRDYKFAQLVRYMYKYNEQFLVFLSSKREIERYAKKYAGVGDNATLPELMDRGVAYHHADISNEYKKTVLDKFKEGEIKVIFCSPTLAVGVNLPATNCVIFDMSYWNDLAFKHEILPADKLTQMFGRAGRVGYSDVGRVIILGNALEQKTAKKHIETPPDIESQFGRILVDRVLNMITNRIANNVPDIYSVIKDSFLFFQHKEFDINIIIQIIELLIKYNLIITNDNYNYRPTKTGAMVTKMYIKVYTLIDALHRVNETKSFSNIFDLFRVFLGNDEFLSSISFEASAKDNRILNASKRYFKKSQFVNSPMLVYVYEKETNTHIKINKYKPLMKSLGIMFKDDILGKNTKLYTQQSTIWKLRREASGIVSRLSVILKDILLKKLPSEELLKQMEMSLKYGTMNSDAIELFQIGGIGEKTIERLMIAGITSKDKLMKTSVNKLKALGVRNAQSIMNKFNNGVSLNQSTLNDWF